MYCNRSRFKHQVAVACFGVMSGSPIYRFGRTLFCLLFFKQQKWRNWKKSSFGAPASLKVGPKKRWSERIRSFLRQHAHLLQVLAGCIPHGKLTEGWSGCPQNIGLRAWTKTQTNIMSTNIYKWEKKNVHHHTTVSQDPKTSPGKAWPGR